MGYYKNLEIAEQIEVGDRKRRSTYESPANIVTIDRTVFSVLLTAVWIQFFATFALMVWVATQ